MKIHEKLHYKDANIRGLKKIRATLYKDRTGKFRVNSKFKAYEKGKENPENYQLVSFTSMPAMFMEKVILEVITKNINEKKVIRNSQCGLIEGKSSLANLTGFCDYMAGWIV
ncbi:hypothetical protein HGM15179_005977 [Zosterops borbonicus]|uniref:Uncharacterized protein n=1 Tax=Zosterops borbonicus TaxID=364589 RepID=A0A8K1GNN8_9PASS|nr:hypothetical protein HGM15179_005977 [Zosterops borbonicus]